MKLAWKQVKILLSLAWYAITNFNWKKMKVNW